MMQIFKIKINSAHDRDNVIIALANAGYKVWVEQEAYGLRSDYCVYYQLKEEQQKATE